MLTTEVWLTIPGKPIHQPRLRHFVRNGHAACYDPSSKAKAEVVRFIKAEAPQAMFKHPHISANFFFPIPESWSKKKKLEHETDRVRYENKPDLDNCLKALWDMLQGIYYEDDKSCSLGPCYKFYSKIPRTEITIVEAT